jgi:hypothetical protein
MLHRFAAATSVAAPAVALETLLALQVPQLKPEGLLGLTTLWCIVPGVWGLWIMAAPNAWVPQRLPLWGAILGLMVGTVAMFVINLREKIVAFTPSVLRRALGVLILVILYYLLWMVVRVAFSALAGNSRAAR